jgi:uncharacterized protein
MRTHSPLVVDVLELLESPGSRKRLSFSAPVPELDAGLSHAGPEVDFDLVAEAIDGGVWVKGTVSGRYQAECRRCLAEVDRPFRFEAAELYRPAGEAWEEGYVIKETSLDLGPLVRDTVLLNLPHDPVCRDDCAGLCPVCGRNLNDEPHAHEPQTDARWSALKDLRAN